MSIYDTEGCMYGCLRGQGVAGGGLELVLPEYMLCVNAVPCYHDRY
jgi:hypothetical protein